MTATAPAENLALGKLEEIKAAVYRLSASEREQLSEYVAHLARLEDPDYLRKLSEASERMAVGDRVSMEDFIRENTEPGSPA